MATEDVRIIQGDCMDVMKTIVAGSVSLIATDPPYFKVKDEDWDHQWESAGAFLEWIGKLCVEWKRVLSPIGSLYVFVSPGMASGVEREIGKWFELLNQIRWIKAEGWHQKTEKEALRSFLSPWEGIVFAEQKPTDRPRWSALLESTRLDSGLSRQDISLHVVGSRSGACWNWEAGIRFPEPEHWRSLRRLFPALPLYDEIVLEHEQRSRCFAVSSDVPNADVWDFPTVTPRPGKHPCEKPLALMEHIVSVSSRPGDLVLDCFAGSGITGQACRNLGRRCILIEKDPHWVNAARVWMDRPHAYFPRKKAKSKDAETPLFQGIT